MLFIFSFCSLILAFLSISSSCFLRARSSASFALAASVTSERATCVFGAVIVSLSDSAELILATSSSRASLLALRTLAMRFGFTMLTFFLPKYFSQIPSTQNVLFPTIPRARCYNVSVSVHLTSAIVVANAPIPSAKMDFFLSNVPPPLSPNLFFPNNQRRAWVAARVG